MKSFKKRLPLGEVEKLSDLSLRIYADLTLYHALLFRRLVGRRSTVTWFKCLKKFKTSNDSKVQIFIERNDVINKYFVHETQWLRYSFVKDATYSKYRFPLAAVVNPVFGRLLGVGTGREWE